MYLIKMATVNPYYYGLVKQIGPWKTTKQDILRGQKLYKYTPNEETENPYTMKSGNGQLYETYSSQGLIYDAATSPVIKNVKGKLKRGKVVRSKKVVQIVDSSGNIIPPTDNYFLNKYMGEMRADNRNQILQSDLGTGMSDAAMLSAIASTATMNSSSDQTYSAISTEVMDAITYDGAIFEDLNIGGEENIDRGAQLNNPIVNDQITYIQNLERERITRQTNQAPLSNILDFNRQDLERPEDIEAWDSAFENANNLGLPAYERGYVDPDIPMAYRERLPTRRRSSTASYTIGNLNEGIRYSQGRPTQRQRRR